MAAFLVIYLLGAIACSALIYYAEREDTIDERNVTIEMIGLTFVMSFFSWISFFVILFAGFGDKTIFKIKKHGKKI